MSDKNNKVFANVNGEQVHVGYAGEVDEGGAQPIELLDAFKGQPLEGVTVQPFDAAIDHVTETFEDSQPEIESADGIEFNVPLTRAEAREQEL